jgi:hypothetical protein
MQALARKLRAASGPDASTGRTGEFASGPSAERSGRSSKHVHSDDQRKVDVKLTFLQILTRGLITY